MRTEQLHYFLTTIESGSFAKASKELNISSSALRESIDSLETEFGVKLLERSKQGVTLSDKGRNMYPAMQHIYNSYLALLVATDSPENAVRDRFQFTVQYSYITYLNSLYHLLKANHPDDAILATHQDSIREMYHKLQNHQTDLALFSRINNKSRQGTDYVALSHDKSLIVLPFFQEGINATMRSNHRLAKNSALSIEDLENELLVFITTNSPIQVYLKHDLSEKSNFVSVPNMSMAETYIQEQNGIMFLPKRFDNTMGSHFVSIPLKPEIFITHYAVYRKNDTRYIIQNAINYLKILIQQEM